MSSTERRRSARSRSLMEVRGVQDLAPRERKVHYADGRIRYFTEFGVKGRRGGFRVMGRHPDPEQALEKARLRFRLHAFESMPGQEFAEVITSTNPAHTMQIKEWLRQRRRKGRKR